MNAAPSELHVLVIFSCEDGRVERLALQSAVGAVQARASIRLRRVSRGGSTPGPEGARMDQDYIAPRPVDLEWADGVVFAVPRPVLSETHLAVPAKRKPAMTLLPDDGYLQQAGFQLFSIQEALNLQGTLDLIDRREALDLTDPGDCCRAGRLFADALRSETRAGDTGSNL
jgi:hypothetical protein